MYVTGLFIYPVKSCSGLSVDSVQIDDLGIIGDRRFMVIDETGRFLTQRTIPRMALIGTALSATALTLSTDTNRSIDIPRAADAKAPLCSVSVWKSQALLAEDCGESVATWLSEFLNTKCRLVRIGGKFLRPIFGSDIARSDDKVSFADGFPLLMISEESLANLNARLTSQGSDQVPMNRFRPNIVVAGGRPYGEDELTRFRAGSVTLHAAGACTRCIITTTDQSTGERGKEPLRTLAKYRRDIRDPSDVIFGQNLVNESKHGEIRVGDSIEFG
jgi:uncharacterized protein